MSKHKGFEKFFKQESYLERMARWLRGDVKKSRYADVPKWVQQETMNKAQQKREMRAKKRITHAH